MLAMASPHRRLMNLTAAFACIGALFVGALFTGAPFVGVAAAQTTTTPGTTTPAATATTGKTGKTGKVAKVTKKKPCRVLTASEIRQVFGARATSNGNSVTPASAVCRWTVDANGDRPSGTLRIGVALGVPKGAYDALVKNPSYVVVEGVGADALYQPSTGALSLFKGTSIVTIRGVFFDASVRPIRTYDAKDLLVGLAQVAIPKL